MKGKKKKSTTEQLNYNHKDSSLIWKILQITACMTKIYLKASFNTQRKQKCKKISTCQNYSM